MFWTRLASGAVLVALMIGLMILGDWPLFVFITLISVIGLYELCKAGKVEKSPAAIIAYLISIGLDILIKYDKIEYMLGLLILGLMLIMAVYVIAYPKYNSKNMILVFFGLVYVTIMMSFIFRVRALENGILNVWLIFIAAWGSDTCAYCVGMLVGKHKLPSELSPKKTIEGCVGGVLGAGLIGFLFAFFAYRGRMDYYIMFPIIGFVGSVISQIGDLTASAIKRNHDIKDYGNLIPGHGGILDRFDSIIFTGPIVYYLLTFNFFG